MIKLNGMEKNKAGGGAREYLGFEPQGGVQKCQEVKLGARSGDTRKIMNLDWPLQ